MTDGNQDDATQLLVEGHEANEKPVESEIQQDHAPVDNNQLESGAPLNENQSNQELSNIDEGESTIEDSLPQDLVAKEDGEPVQAAENVKPVEQVESEPAEDKPDGNLESSCDNKTASQIQEGEQIESGGVGEQQQDADDQKDVPSDEKEQSDTTAAGEAEVGDTMSTAHTEQQEHDTPVISGQEQQDSPIENTGQETPAPSQEQQDIPDVNKEQEIVAYNQEQQDSPAENEKSDKPVDGSNNQEIMEEQQPEEGQANGEVTKEILENENSPDSETTPAVSDTGTEEAQKPDEASQESGNGLENEDIKSEPTVEEPNQTAPKVEIPVESPQAVQPEATTACTAQGVTVPADELQEENKKLKQDMFMMKQQEDAYRIKVLSLEQEVGKLRARKIDNRSQDSLASDSDSYLKQKLAETERELDTAERKVKDLQLRLKRFAKDDQIKDEKISQMEREVKELSDHTKKLEQSLADSKRENNNNATMQAGADKNDSKVCVIL